MATAAVALPPGFELEAPPPRAPAAPSPGASGLPPGFELETGPATSPRPPIVMGANPSVLGIAARTVGNDLWGAAGTAANAVANIPHAAIAAVDNLLQHAGGVEHPQPTHALEVTNTTPEMREFQQAVGQSPLVQNPVTQAVIGKAKELATAHPVLADVASDIANLVPAVGAARAVEGGVAGLSAARQAAADAAENTAAQTPVEIARAAGYKLKPTEAGAGIIAKSAEGLTGSKRLENDLIEHNQGVTNQLAAQEVGLPAGKPITDQALNKAKQPHNAVYDEVGKTLGTLPTDAQFRADIAAIGSPGGESFSFDAVPEIERLKNGYGGVQSFTADDAIAKMRQLRRDAGQNIRAPYDPDRQAKGYAQQAVADALESQMERAAQASTSPDLLERFRAARQSLAKIANVQNALDENGNVSALKLGKAADKGAPLSGRLGIIADTARSFPNVMSDLTKLKQRSGFTVPELAFSAGEAIPALAYGHPLTAAAGIATVAARHGVRALLGSDLYQNALGPVARDLTGARLGEYFPRAAETAPAAPAMASGGLPFTATRAASPGELSPAQALLASRLAGDLELAPEAPGHGLPFEPSDVRLGDLTAATPPPVRGDVPFTPSEPVGTAMAGNMKLAQPAPTGGITFTPSEPNPRAAGMSEQVPGTARTPERRAIRSSGREVGPGLTLEQAPQPPATPLALPPPTRGPIAVDQAGRAGVSPADVAAHRQAMGLDELGPGVRQPAAGPNPEREAAAAQARQSASQPVALTGKEITPSPGENIASLKQKAHAYAQGNFADKTVTNRSDGSQILITKAGIDHAFSGKVSRKAALATAQLDRILENGKLVSTEADKAGRQDILAVHHYDTPITIAGKPTTIRSVVRELPDGRRYYDHFEVREDGSSGSRGTSGASPAAGAAQAVRTSSEARPTAIDVGTGKSSTEPPKTLARGAPQFVQRSAQVPNRAAFLNRFQQLSEDSPTNPAGRLFSKNVSVELQPEPTDEHTVHIEDLRALTTGHGHGAAALKKLTGLADRHGVRLTLDAHPLDKGGISKEKLQQFYQRQGFEPAADEWRPNLMVREPK